MTPEQLHKAGASLDEMKAFAKALDDCIKKLKLNANRILKKSKPERSWTPEEMKPAKASSEPKEEKPE